MRHTNVMIALRALLIVFAFALASADAAVINLGVIFDLQAYPWAEKIVNVTVQMINREWQAKDPNHPQLVYYLKNNPDCDEKNAIDMFWEIFNKIGGKLHGIVGTRCSPASMALAWILSHFEVPQIAPTSNSHRLSNEEKYPLFSRMVAPNDWRGEVGAIVAMLKEFDWKRVCILNTSNQYAIDAATALNEDLENEGGKVAWRYTFPLNSNGDIDSEAIQQGLKEFPANDPDGKPRIIVVMAHKEHAFKILHEAAESNAIPDDVVFIGSSSWAPDFDGHKDLFWIKDSFPGYLLVVPRRYKGPEYQSFLDELHHYEDANGMNNTKELPLFARELIDSIRAMAYALANWPDKNDGPAVVKELRKLVFDGTSGLVSFTEAGDRKNPAYEILNGRIEDGTLVWKTIGNATSDSVIIWESVCFPKRGCGPVSNAPSDSHDPPPSEKVIRVSASLGTIGALSFVAFVISCVKNWRTTKEFHSYKQSVAFLRTAIRAYIPRVSKRGGDIEQALDDTAQWIWQESPEAMFQHQGSPFVYDFGDCWLRFDDESNDKLEKAWREGPSKINHMPGREVDLTEMKQTNISTGFKRNIKRVMKDDSFVDLSDTDIEVGSKLPADLEGQPLVVLVEGDVLRISKQRAYDDWVFGTKVRNAKESTARELVAIACKGSDPDSVNVFQDSGWFEMSNTRTSTDEDLKFIDDNVEDGALACPETWVTPVKDPSIVERHPLPPGEERSEVEEAFLSTLDRSRIRVVKIERIQNLAMYQSYVVKRQTICNREIAFNGGDPSDQTLQRDALDRYERKLYHGTNVEVVDNILQQGFNRSFCGRNATRYGRGVYYARDASYSACTTYAEKDRNGFQYVLACRVCIGEYCVGWDGALTPDVRDPISRTLYDSTVDDENNPSVFVSYHDAQGYPEYLITFKELPRAHC